MQQKSMSLEKQEKIENQMDIFTKKGKQKN